MAADAAGQARALERVGGRGRGGADRRLLAHGLGEGRRGEYGDGGAAGAGSGALRVGMWRAPLLFFLARRAHAGRPIIRPSLPFFFKTIFAERFLFLALSKVYFAESGARQSFFLF